jgi:GMP synthase (glutamine-hydrolysing)
MEAPDVGWHEVTLTADGREDPVLGGLPERFTAFDWHSFETQLPRDATALALGGGRIAGFRLGCAWGVQFHAEITREMLGDWIGSYREDPDLMAAGVDPTPVLEEAGARIGQSTAVGVELAGRFVDHVAGLAAGSA